jgi:Zn finger protein HypA/HybF involved in hydrogenase expression
MKTVIELLKESGELINHCIGKFPMGEVELYEAEKLRDKIDEFLAKPAPDAMELVRMIRGKSPQDRCVACGAPFALHQYQTNFCPKCGKEAPAGEEQHWAGTAWIPVFDYDYSDTEAAALIESYSHRVPRAMLDEYASAFCESMSARLNLYGFRQKLADEIAAKYGVEVEG